ncbi:MAG TPA: prolipoprotein diacylglyceryl transferase, partial [Candidatus Woesebacteria bacterium]|nr:prolipoprotein diacylglyceryl transferase [Candidatus Woesebacteria bacterium]
ALIGGILYIFFFSLFSRISFLKILDSITPILPLCQAIGRIGNFFNHEIPVWWLEASLNLILFFIIKSEALKNYSSTALYLIGYGSIRFFIEFFRNDTWTINGVKIAQLISIISLVIGIILINYEKIKIVQKDH